MKSKRLCIFGFLLLVLLLSFWGCDQANDEKITETEGTHACVHTWNDATCVTSRICSLCNETEGNPLGHSWKDATCTTAKTCSVCNETEGESLGHSWVDATCTTPKICFACNETAGKALGHAWANATCTVPKTCSDCGEIEGRASGHSWKNATCTKPKTCVVCAETEGLALGHKWEKATCTKPRTCSTCQETNGVALGHAWISATCTTAKVCENCGAQEGRALGHEWMKATCTTPKCCANCDAFEGDALGHDWQDATCQKPRKCSECYETEGRAIDHDWTLATCTEASKCTMCNKKQGEALGHTYVSGKCETCGARDPNYVPVFSIGDTWVVDGRFELTIDSVAKHELCYDEFTEEYGFSGMYGVMVEYHYKNIGSSDTFRIDHEDISVYDGEGEKGRYYSGCDYYYGCGGEKEATYCVQGGKASAAYCYAVPNDSSSVTIYVKLLFTDYKAKFIVDNIHVHEFTKATCLAPKTCTICEKTEGGKGDHNYIQGFCTLCGGRDLDYVPTLKVGEKWVVAGEWEFTVNSVTTHYMCNKYETDKGQVVIINYTYKNLGYHGNYQDLYFCEWTAMDVYDGRGVAAKNYTCNHGDDPQVCVIGKSCTADAVVVLTNNSSKITVVVSKYMSNTYGEVKASFELTIN